MKNEIIITIRLFGLICICVLFFSSKTIRESVARPLKRADSTFFVPQLTIGYHQYRVKAVEKSPIAPEVPAPQIIIQNIALKQISFLDLPGWDTTDIKKSLSVFQNSCKKFLSQDPNEADGSKYIDIRAKDWQSPCRVALAIDPITDKSAKEFFENWFDPVEFNKDKPISGLFTGYYMPVVKGNLIKTSQYNIPIYGAVKHNSKKNKHPQKPVIAWIKSSLERLFLQIEGAGIIQLPSGKRLYISYENRKAEPLNQQDALGAHGIILTPGYSLAIDKDWIPLGSPLWLSTVKPNIHENNESSLQRLMIAQDIGGAIRGIMRGDVYWGEGETADFLGNNMKNEGRYWLLLPKQALVRLFADFEFNSFMSIP
ncbi:MULTISPECIES: MltA domain-containing protein [Legionella]|uniref:MltA domain-containing protein n=1 Tax=Legionella TaxID=445 RepID=UPI001AC408DE|nr:MULTISPECIES: MltA domain-containing protein [Legionella]MBN9227833.1 MltA domain-containing protein [Legionella steelei]